MPLSTGTKLGPYETLTPHGAGGMGEVYKARDTRLDRTVAVKVSKQHFTERFEREARAGKEYLRAIELDPDRAFTHETYGWYLTCLGSPEKGIAEGRKAEQLDPLSADLYQILSQDLYLVRQYPEAIEQARQALEVDPKYFLSHLQLGLIRDAGQAQRSHRRSTKGSGRRTFGGLEHRGSGYGLRRRRKARRG
jgi:hypothetical protein